MVTRANGTAIPLRMSRILVATISSIKVKPRSLCFLRISIRTSWQDKIARYQRPSSERRPKCPRLPALLNCNRRAGPIDWKRLHSWITSSAPCDRQRCLTRSFSNKRERHYSSLTRNSRRSGRPRGHYLHSAVIFAMRNCYDLPILRQKAAVRNVCHLQELRIVRNLHRHLEDILPAVQKHVDGKRGTHMLGCAGRIKAESGRTLHQLWSRAAGIGRRGLGDVD